MFFQCCLISETHINGPFLGIVSLKCGSFFNGWMFVILWGDFIYRVVPNWGHLLEGEGGNLCSGVEHPSIPSPHSLQRGTKSHLKKHSLT